MPTVPNRSILLLLLSFCIWASALVVVYALHAFGCTFAWAPATIRIALGVAVLAHLALIGWAWRRVAGSGSDPATGLTGAFFRWVILWTLIAAFVTVIFTLGPSMLLSTCI